MLKFTSLLLGGTLLLLITRTGVSVLPPRPPQELQAIASHIFVGEVQRRYECVEPLDANFEIIQGVVELGGLQVEQGQEQRPLVYVRYWRKQAITRKAAIPGDYGHRNVPNKGDRVRVYVTTAEDGGYDVIKPNGFEPPQE